MAKVKKHETYEQYVAEQLAIQKSKQEWRRRHGPFPVPLILALRKPVSPKIELEKLLQTLFYLRHNNVPLRTITKVLQKAYAEQPTDTV